MESPKYKEGDKVTFSLYPANQELEGVVYIVDRYGTFFNPSEPSYDIFYEADNTLYKHIAQSRVIGLA